jgi:hypothetical protein
MLSAHCSAEWLLLHLRFANRYVQYFTSEQLEDLEGVLWKSYFA